MRLPRASCDGGAERSEELLAGGELLRDHARCGDHREAAAVELLGLHILELLLGGGLEAERVPAVVAGEMRRPDGPRLLRRGLERGDDREDLDHRDRGHDSRPEGLQRRLLEGDVRRHVDVATEERVELLGDGEAERGKHRDARVLDLDLAVEADLALRSRVVATEEELKNMQTKELNNGRL